MAEMEMKSAKKKTGKRMLKKSTRVDLTPMVDLGFLLITFFVFTTTMAKPVVMNILTPKDSPDSSPVCETCALTVILAGGDKIFYYEGIQQSNTVLKQTSFDTAGIRMLLMKKKELVKRVKGNADDMVLIVKPSAESRYKNFVDILDEVAITRVKHYFIDELNEWDKKMLPENH
jgi:biopolymer transport protein ExbD